MQDAELDRAVGLLRVGMLADPAGPSDAELLERFRRQGDEAAYAAIVARHGTTVFSACRQVLRDPADIDDAFQATFLVLFRKINSVKAGTLGNWLYSAALRIAVRANWDARRRAQREKTAAERRPGPEQADMSWRETISILYGELDQLPNAYRTVLILCYLRGLSRDEAAASLGWSVGAVKGKLERGRKLLAARLTKRGVGLSVGLLAALKADMLDAKGPGWYLITDTVRKAGAATKPAVAALAAGAFPMMTMPWKILAGMAIAGGIVVLAGTGSGSLEQLTEKTLPPALKQQAPLELKMDEPVPAKTADKLASPNKPVEKAGDEAVPKRPQSDVGKLLNRMKKLKFASDERAGTLREFIQLGPKAVPELIAELDSTNDEMMLRYLAFVCRGIGDKRLIPALIRAFPKACVPAGASDFGCTVQDPELLAFMQQHDYTRGKSKPVYAFGRPINEFRATLQQLTGSTHGEDELVYVYLEGPPHQRLLQRSLFQSCAARWARWWQAHWKEYVSDGYYSRVNLGPLPAEETRTSLPRAVETSNVYGSRADILLEPVGKAGALHVFFDLDTGRRAALPAFLRAPEGQAERIDDIVAWAAAEGFDLMCTEHTFAGQTKPEYVMRGLGLATWQIDKAHKQAFPEELAAGKPLHVGRQSDGLLARFDVTNGQYKKDAQPSFLFRTREGTHGVITVYNEWPEILRFNSYLISGGVKRAGALTP